MQSFTTYEQASHIVVQEHLSMLSDHKYQLKKEIEIKLNEQFENIPGSLKEIRLSDIFNLSTETDYDSLLLLVNAKNNDLHLSDKIREKITKKLHGRKERRYHDCSTKAPTKTMKPESTSYHKEDDHLKLNGLGKSFDTIIRFSISDTKEPKATEDSRQDSKPALVGSKTSLIGPPPDLKVIDIDRTVETLLNTTTNSKEKEKAELTLKQLYEKLGKIVQKLNHHE